MKRLSLVLCLLSALLLQAATPQTSQTSQTSQTRKLVANDADVDFALRCAESAIKQYNAMPEAKKKKLEQQVAKAAGAKDVNAVSQTMRTMAAQAKTKSLVTKENKAATKAFLNANPKWCGTVKAARIGQQTMQKLGMKGEMSLDEMLDLIPE